MDSLAQSKADTVVTVDPLGDSNWDIRLQQCPHATFYHSSAWARVLHDTYGYKTFYLALGSRDNPRAVLPIMEVDSRLTGRRGVSLPFTDDCEPACEDPIAFQQLFRHAQLLGKDREWRHLECRGGVDMLPAAQSSLTYFGHRVALSPDEGVLFRNFHSATRRAVRKAERSGLTIEVSDGSDATRAFYELSCTTRKRHGLPPQPFAFYENIRRHVLAAKKGQIVLARYDREPVAAAMFFHGPKTAIMKFAASDLRYQHLRINNLVMWEAMKHYGRAGFATMDFGRTSLWNDGLRSFKLRWGALEHQINYHRFDFRQAQFIHSPDTAAGWQVRIFQYMPIPLSKIAGAIFYKHMA